MKLKTLALAALMVSAAPAAAEVKIAVDTAPDLATSGSYNWAHAFGQALTEAGFEVREMPRDAVGNEAEKVDQITTGLLEISLSDIRVVAQLDLFIYGLRLPSLFYDAAHLQGALTEGQVFDQVNEVLGAEDAMPLAIAPLGPSSGIITTTTAIRRPEDRAGLRMRALDDAQIARYEAWGSAGTMVPWGEVPAGLLNGYLNAPFVPISFGQTDFVRTYADAGVIIPARAILASRHWDDGLSDAERAAVGAAVDTANAATAAWLAEVAESSLTVLEAAGVTVQRLTAEEREAFRRRAQAVYESGLMPSDAVARWQAIAAASR